MDVTCEIEKNRQAEVVLACLGIARRYQGWRYIKTALEWALAGWEPAREVFIRLGVTYRVSAAAVKQSVSRALWQARVHRPEELAYMTFYVDGTPNRTRRQLCALCTWLRAFEPVCVGNGVFRWRLRE